MRGVGVEGTARVVAIGVGEGGITGLEMGAEGGGREEGRGEVEVGFGSVGARVVAEASLLDVGGGGDTVDASAAAPPPQALVPNQVERRAASDPGAPASRCRLTTCGTVPPPTLVSGRALTASSSPGSATGEAARGTSSSISISAPSSLSLLLRSTTVRPLATLAKLAPLDLAFPFIVMLLLPLRPLRMLSLSSSISAF